MLGATAGYGKGLYFNYVIADKCCRVEIYIDFYKDRDYNKRVFDALHDNRDAIATAVQPYEVKWSRLDDKRASRIYIEKDNISMGDKNEWETVSNFLIEAMTKFIAAIDGYRSLIEGC